MTVAEEGDLKYHVELRKHDLSRGIMMTLHACRLSRSLTNYSDARFLFSCGDRVTMVRIFQAQ